MVKSGKTVFLLLFALLMTARTACAQDVALKTNSLYWAAATPNIGVEIGLSPKWTLDLGGAYKPFNIKDDRYARFWLVQPEARYWFCEKFEGHFVGLHAHAAQFYSGWNGTIYDGYLAGGGVTYGYDWILSPHWNLEAAVGVGYARLWYDKMPDGPCVKCTEDEFRNYFGVTKLALTFSYIF